MAIFKSLLAVAIALVGTAHAAPQLQSRQSPVPVLNALGSDFIGCWSDDTSRRTLKQTTLTDATGMTIEKCITFCNNGSFNLAGLENAKECWCSNAMDNGPTLIPDSKCGQSCVGDVLEGNCGGPNALSVFRRVVEITLQ